VSLPPKPPSHADQAATQSSPGQHACPTWPQVPVQPVAEQRPDLSLPQLSSTATHSPSSSQHAPAPQALPSQHASPTVPQLVQRPNSQITPPSVQ